MFFPKDQIQLNLHLRGKRGSGRSRKVRTGSEVLIR